MSWARELARRVTSSSLGGLVCDVIEAAEAALSLVEIFQGGLKAGLSLAEIFQWRVESWPVIG